jgi:aldehyde:ferredoxin oxidoreductase
MTYGFSGKILHVDLSEGNLEIEQPEPSFYRKYPGGSALGMYYLLRHTPANADPLGSENTIVFSVGPLTGAPISGQSRLTVTAKSPLTGTAGDSQSGGFFPAEMKFAGFDAVVVYGRAQEPVYLWIHDGEAELRPATHVWGQVTGQVDATLKEELGDEKIQVLQCGPAGEQGVRFAAIMSMANRANGRNGLGAVMGSKRLKAIVVRGDEKPAIAAPDALKDLARWGAKHIKGTGMEGLGVYGTAEVIRYQDAAGGLPTRNWSSGTFEGHMALDGTTMAETILKERDTCYACAVRCKRVVEAEQAAYPLDPIYGGPEYESLAALGSYCGVDDLYAVAYANQLCNMYGMDTISCGASIAWAMDCFEQGILTADDTGGLDLTFGNAEALVQLVEQIGRRQGFGALLAEGSARAAAQFGAEAENLVVAAKKQEYPAHMPQVKRSLALIYTVNPFGADHESSEHDPSYRSFPERLAEIGLTDPQPDDVLNEEKVRFTLVSQHFYACMDTVNVCQFVFGPAWQLYGAEDLATAMRVVTGWDIDVDELLEIGERRVNMMRAFNARDGIDRSEDTLPKKLQKALSGGASDGAYVPAEQVEQAKEMYYELAGWDVDTGTPTRVKLEELDLAWVADELGL